MPIREEAEDFQWSAELLRFADFATGFVQHLSDDGLIKVSDACHRIQDACHEEMAKR